MRTSPIGRPHPLLASLVRVWRHAYPHRPHPGHHKETLYLGLAKLHRPFTNPRILLSAEGPHFRPETVLRHRQPPLVAVNLLNLDFDEIAESSHDVGENSQNDGIAGLVNRHIDLEIFVSIFEVPQIRNCVVRSMRLHSDADVHRGQTGYFYPFRILAIFMNFKCTSRSEHSICDASLDLDSSKLSHRSDLEWTCLSSWNGRTFGGCIASVTLIVLFPRVIGMDSVFVRMRVCSLGRDKIRRHRVGKHLPTLPNGWRHPDSFLKIFWVFSWRG